MTVINVAPTVAAGSDATIDKGGTFTRTGSFTDPGTDSWTATVDYGDGSGEQPLVLNAERHRFESLLRRQRYVHRNGLRPG